MTKIHHSGPRHVARTRTDGFLSRKPTTKPADRLAAAIPTTAPATWFARSAPRQLLWMGVSVAAVALSADPSFAAAGLPLWLAFTHEPLSPRQQADTDAPTKLERRLRARHATLTTRILAGRLVGLGAEGYWGAFRLFRIQAVALKEAGQQWATCHALAHEAALALDIGQTDLAGAAVAAGRHNADHKYSFVGKGEAAMQGYLTVHEALTAAATRATREGLDYVDAATRYERAAAQVSGQPLAMFMSWAFNTIGTRGIMQLSDTDFEKTEVTDDWQRIAAWRAGEYRVLAARAQRRVAMFAEAPEEALLPTRVVSPEDLPIDWMIGDYARIRKTGILPKSLKVMGAQINALKKEEKIIEALSACRDYVARLSQAGQCGQAHFVLETALAWTKEFQALRITLQRNARMVGVVDGQIHGVSELFAERSDRWEAEKRVAQIEAAQIHLQLGQLLHGQWRPLLAATHFAQVRHCLAPVQDAARNRSHDQLLAQATQWQLASLAEAGVIDAIEALRVETRRLEARDREDGNRTTEAVEAKRRWMATLEEADIFEHVPIDPTFDRPSLTFDLPAAARQARHAVATALVRQAEGHFAASTPQLGIEALLQALDHADAIRDTDLQATVRDAFLQHESTLPSPLLHHILGWTEVHPDVAVSPSSAPLDLTAPPVEPADIGPTLPDAWEES